MIISGQMTREEAIERMKEPLYEQSSLEADLDFVLSKIGMSRQEFDELMKADRHMHNEYPISLLNVFARIILKLRKKLLKY